MLSNTLRVLPEQPDGPGLSRTGRRGSGQDSRLADHLGSYCAFLLPGSCNSVSTMLSWPQKRSQKAA